MNDFAAALACGCAAGEHQFDPQDTPRNKAQPALRLTRRGISCGEVGAPGPVPRSVSALAIILAIAAGLLVWHATRANQARLGIRSRHAQIRAMRREIRLFGRRGIVVLIVFILLIVVALKY